MTTTALHEFIDFHRDDLVQRCATKMAESWISLPRDTEIDHGVPTFLDQVSQELRDGPSQTGEIRQSARNHAYALLARGLPIEQVVHTYGNICQSITDLAVELAAGINADDFRTLNRCLDDAIASGVSEYCQGRDVSRRGSSQHLQELADTALNAFEVLRSGTVGVGGSTGAVIFQSLTAIRGTLVDQQLAEDADEMIRNNAPVSTPSA